MPEGCDASGGTAATATTRWSAMLEGLSRRQHRENEQREACDEEGDDQQLDGTDAMAGADLLHGPEVGQRSRLHAPIWPPCAGHRYRVAFEEITADLCAA